MTFNFPPTLAMGQGGMASALADPLSDQRAAQLGLIAHLDPDGTLAKILHWLQDTGLSQDSRPIRLRIQRGQTAISGALLAHSLRIDEEVCASTSVHMRVLGLCTRADLSPAALLGMPVSIQMVTDQGKLREVNGIVTKAVPGQSDGGAQVWLIEAHDALTIKRMGRNTRVFLRHSVLDIAKRLLGEWRQSDPVLAEAFDFDLSRLNAQNHPVREMLIQWNESDADFLMRLLRKQGIGWAVRPGSPNRDDDGTGTPCHTLVLFDDSMALPQNEAGTLRYHQGGAAQERDGIMLWSPVLSLVPGSVERRTFDYKSLRVHEHQIPGSADLGRSGRELAKGVVDAAIDPPHWGDSQQDFQRLTTLRMLHHEMASCHVQGASGSRDAACMTWVDVQGLPEASAMSAQDRQYLFLQVTHHGQNNLPKALNERITGMFAASGWEQDRPVIGTQDESRRYVNTFKAVSRKMAVVPAFDAATDWPALHAINALVVCPPGEEVHTDQDARIKLRFLGLRVTDNEHAQGAGTSGTDADSAWVRLALGSAGGHRGFIHLPRAGDEVIVSFLMGDPDKPFICAVMHGPRNPPPAFHKVGGLPGNRYESGNFVSEIQGNGYVQTRFDATPGQISYNVTASSAMASLNLGRLYTPRQDGAAEPRGEGAELRTEGAAVVAGHEGFRATTEAAHPTQGRMLAREQLVGLTRTLSAAAQQLGDLAKAHDLPGLDMAKLNEWLQSLEQWDQGTNVEPGRQGGRKPIMALDSTAGTGVLSHNNLLLGAQTHVDTVAAGRIQASAGQDIRHLAGGNVEHFAHGSVLVRAGKGEVLVSADRGNVTITGAKAITVAAAEELNLSAKVVKVLAEGAQTSWGAGAITEQASDTFAIQSSSFEHGGGGGGTPLALNLPGGSMSTDERYVIKHRASGRPRPNQRYRIVLNDDRIIQGITDEQGRTDMAAADAIHIAQVILLKGSTT